MKTPNYPSNKYITRLCALILPLASLAFGSSSAFGATDVWIGQDSTNGNFSDSDNWSGGHKPTPLSNNDLVFGSVTAAQTTANNNFTPATLFPPSAGTGAASINSITFVDPTPTSIAQSFTLTGSGVFLGTGKTGNVIIDSSGSSVTQTISLSSLTINGLPFVGAPFQHIVTGDADLDITSNINLLGASIGLQGGAGTIRLTGTIAGVGSNSQPATIVIGNSSTSTGGNVLISGDNVNSNPLFSLNANSSGYTVNLQDGTLIIGNDHALGAGNLLINGASGNTLATDDSHTIANGITANSDFYLQEFGTLQVNGLVTLTPTGTATSITVTQLTTNTSGSFVMNGGLAGGGAGISIVLSGDNALGFPSEYTLSGTTVSTYTGTLVVDNTAILNLNVTPSAGGHAVTGDLVIDASSIVNDEQSHQLAAGGATNLTADGTFQMNGYHETINNLDGEGAVVIGHGGQLTLNSGDFGTIGQVALTDGSDVPGGRVVKDGAGTFTLYGKSDYSGSTTINDGTFAAGAFDVFDANSRYNVNSHGTLAIEGRFQHIGSLTGRGVVENGGVSDAFLAIGEDDTSTTFRGILEDGDGGGTLGIIKVGDGALLLDGHNNTYSGGTAIVDGQLLVGTSSALGTGDVFMSGGSLRYASNSHHGHDINVGGNYDQIGGTLNLGIFHNGSNDELVVAGDSVKLGSDSAIHLHISGVIGPVSTSTSYILVDNAAGGITGTFGSVSGLGHFDIPTGLFGTLDYSPTDVTLLFRQYLGLTQGLTPNQQSIANFLDRLESVNTAGSYGKVVDGLYNGGSQGLGGNLDQLSSQQFAQFASATAFNNAVFETQAMDNYLNGLRSGPNGTFVGGNGKIDSTGLTVNDPNYDSALQTVHSRLLAWSPTPQSGLLSDSGDAVLGGVDMKDSKDVKSMASAPGYTNPWNLFVRGNIILAQGSSQQDTGYFSDNSESVVIGTDYRICPNFLVGVTLGYAHTDATLDNAGSSATVDSYSPGVYAAWADKGWYANFNGAYTYNSYSDTRNISFLGQSSTGNTRGNQGSVNLDGGYDFHSGCMTFGPLVGLQYTHLTVKGYDESGSDASLNVDRDQSDSLRSRLGGRVAWNTKMGGIGLNPHLDASWQHEFMDQSRGITSQFNTFGGGSFVVQTVNPSRESALLDAGINIDVTDTITVFTDYMAQVGQDNYFGQSVQAGAKFGF